MPLPTEARERAPLALWATPPHASLMASTTTDGNLAVYDDGAVCVSDNPEHANGPSLATADRWIVDSGTQSMMLSAAFNNRVSCSSQGGPYSIVVVAVAYAEHDSASMC